MATFVYSYLDPQKRKRRGRLDAPSLLEAKEKLRSQGILVTELKNGLRSGKHPHLKRHTLLNITQQLHQLLVSGLPLFDSLSLIAEQYQSDRIHATLAKLCKEIEEGKSLSKAMEEMPHSFPPLYTAMIASGEASGALEEVLGKLATLLSRQQRLRKQIATSMVYPTVIGCFCLIVIFLLLVFVIPSIKVLYSDHSLSPFTQLVLGVSDFLSSKWPLYLPALAAALLGAAAYFRSPKGQKMKRGLTGRLPLIKHLILRNALARFTRALATLQQGGVTLVDALSLSQQLLNHPTLEPLMARTKEKIVGGSSLSQELKESPLIPPMVTRMLAVGEESGQLPNMLEAIATHYEEEVERTLTRLASLAQPIILIVMGGLIGIIMLAVLLPLTDVSHLI